MRVAICFTLMALARLTLAQDPTVPSPALQERLSVTTPVVGQASLQPLPILKLKSLVLRDRDHGTATIESDGQKYFLNLDRNRLRQEDDGQSQTNGRNHVQIGGREYRVDDFYPRTIVLHDGQRRVMAQ